MRMKIYTIWKGVMQYLTERKKEKKYWKEREMMIVGERYCKWKAIECDTL